MCVNTRFANNESQVIFEEIPLDVKAAMAHLRAQPGITKVVLFGHSGGGPSMSLYQAVAENGVAYCKGPNKMVECGDDLAGLTPADGIIFADAHPSNAILALRGLNPSVANENNPPRDRIAELDPFDPKNGFNPNGNSTYSADFQNRYFAAQSARMNKLIDLAQDRMKQIKAGTYPYSDDDILIVPRGGPSGPGAGASAYLYQTDPSLAYFSATTRPSKLLKNDGTVKDDAIVHSVAKGDPTLAKRHLTYIDGTRTLTLKSFLSANAIRSKNSKDDIDICSSNNSTICAVQQISVPVMFAAMGAYFFVGDNERMFDLAKSKDKDLVTIEGATHGFTPCVPCGPTPDAYANSVKNLFDYAAAWINKRF
jgi:pimeloyl-ACP methyl ester carboxylesterase